ncbi:unnamed protein product [Effrenium voratum]|uniref:Pentatricopeptide repeat-containing protein, chloroplastic n=1 Tax=Effrenium voratum TaxID=2562239 RepID=A0AA36NLD0_9DINO|nr:unnamed protein product [Effrenium voratum]
MGGKRPVQEECQRITALGRGSQWRLALSAFASFGDKDTPLLNAAAAACTRGLAWASALSLLSALPKWKLQGDQLSLNSAATAFEKGSRWQQALRLAGEGGDIATFSAAISAVGRGGGPWALAPALLARARSQGLQLDVIICSAAINASVKGPRWEVALELLEWMRELRLQPNLICFGAAISACGKGRHWQGSWALLEEIWSMELKPDLVIFNAAITACEKAQRWEFALELLSLIRVHRISPDVVSFNAAASACEKRTQWRWALWVYDSLMRTLPERKRGGLLNISNACISACAKALCWQHALLLAQNMEQPDKVTYNGLIAACAAPSGFRWQMVLALLAQMGRPGADVLAVAADACLAAWQSRRARLLMDTLEESCSQGARLDLSWGTISGSSGARPAVTGPPGSEIHRSRWISDAPMARAPTPSRFQAVRAKLNSLSYVQPLTEESLALVERLLEDLLKSAECGRPSPPAMVRHDLQRAAVFQLERKWSFRLLEQTSGRHEQQMQDVTEELKRLHEEHPQLLKENIELHRRLLQESPDLDLRSHLVPGCQGGSG